MNRSFKPLPRWPVYLTSALLAAFVFLFIFEFITATDNPVFTPQVLDESAYEDEVIALLAEAEPQNGEALVVEYDCVACHREGAKNGIAPPFAGIAARAASRRPPLSAASYIYESILYPTAYVVEGFSGAMPQNYPSRLTERQLGDIIAYLLSPGSK